jgi:23S rRNA (uracil1939-C5)-methyltransferase
MRAQHPTETVVIEKMAAGGDAIAHAADGRVLFVTGALPGETVEVEIHTTKKDFAKGVARLVLDAAPHRVDAPCPALAAGCGGCGWQHVSAEGQRELKRDIVVDALRRTAKIAEPPVEVGGGVPAWGYRTSMRLAVAPNGRGGLRAGSSHRVVELVDCPVAHPALAALLPSLIVKGADEVSLRVSASTGEATALLSKPNGRVSGLPSHVGVGSSAVLHETVNGRSMRVSAASFFQSGPAAAELLLRTVRSAGGDLLHDSGPVLDGYGGAGLFSAGLGLEQPILVESSRSACADAVVNVPDAQVHCVPFEEWTPEPVKLAIVDPARAGLGASAVEVLAGTGAERVVLVSCDPVAMARDTRLLIDLGFAYAGSTVLDLFPNTPHVEVVTVFTR